MTVGELLRELSKYYPDRQVEISCDSGIVIPVQVDWDSDRRCISLDVAPAPDIQEPYMYEDEMVCTECGNIKEVDDDCFCCGE